MFKKAIAYILGIGISIELNPFEKKRLKVFNGLTSIGILTNLIFGFIIFPEYLIVGVFHFIMVFGYLLTIYAHLKMSYRAALLMFWVTNISYFLIFSSVISPENISLYFTTMLVLVLLFFNSNKVKISSVILLSIGLYLKLNHGLYFSYVEIDHPLNNTFGLIILILLIILAYKNSNKSYETELNKQYEKAIETQRLLDFQKQELKDLNEFKSHFFINLSHDIRTPLTLIKGHASRIDLEGSKTDNLEKLNIIKQQIDQIQSIVDNIIDLSKISTGHFSLHPNWVSLSVFFEKHYHDFKGLFVASQINFQLKNTSKKFIVNIDEHHFSKSINNLLNNALKFTPKGGTVTLSILKNDTGLAIELSDTGIGIPKEEQQKIFERFYQSKNHITKSQGSGIGLSFTKDIVEKHGFTIELESEPNIKTTFKILIPKTALKESPFLEDDVASTPVCKIEPKVSRVVNKKSKPSILIVDDHTQMRSFIKAILEEYQITEAENGKEALKLVKRQSFDVIITDYMMPVMDGETFVRALKELRIKTPVLVLTARIDQGGKLTMLRLGIDGYLVKPFLEEELLMCVRNSLKLHKRIKAFDASLSDTESEIINNYADKFNKALNDFITSNIQSHTFGVEDIATFLNISKSTLNRKTKSILGLSPKELIMEVRLQKAFRVLEEAPSMTKKSVANSVGISNSNYFFKKMEQRFGRTF